MVAFTRSQVSSTFASLPESGTVGLRLHVPPDRLPSLLRCLTRWHAKEARVAGSPLAASKHGAERHGHRRRHKHGGRTTELVHDDAGSGVPRTASDLSTMSEGVAGAVTDDADGALAAMDPGISPVQVEARDVKRAHGSGSKGKTRHKRHRNADGASGGGSGAQAAAAASRKRLAAVRERLHEALWSALPTYAPVFNSIPPL